jgi:hypothetical protein
MMPGAGPKSMYGTAGRKVESSRFALAAWFEF